MSTCMVWHLSSTSFLLWGKGNCFGVLMVYRLSILTNSLGFSQIPFWNNNIRLKDTEKTTTTIIIIIKEVRVCVIKWKTKRAPSRLKTVKASIESFGGLNELGPSRLNRTKTQWAIFSIMNVLRLCIFHFIFSEHLHLLY